MSTGSYDEAIRDELKSLNRTFKLIEGHLKETIEYIKTDYWKPFNEPTENCEDCGCILTGQGIPYSTDDEGCHWCQKCHPVPQATTSPESEEPDETTKAGTEREPEGST